MPRKHPFLHRWVDYDSWRELTNNGVGTYHQPSSEVTGNHKLLLSDAYEVTGLDALSAYSYDDWIEDRRETLATTILARPAAITGMELHAKFNWRETWSSPTVANGSALNAIWSPHCLRQRYSLLQLKEPVPIQAATMLDGAWGGDGSWYSLEAPYKRRCCYKISVYPGIRVNDEVNLYHTHPIVLYGTYTAAATGSCSSLGEYPAPPDNWFGPGNCTADETLYFHLFNQCMSVCVPDLMRENAATIEAYRTAGTLTDHPRYITGVAVKYTWVDTDPTPGSPTGNFAGANQGTYFSPDAYYDASTYTGVPGALANYCCLWPNTDWAAILGAEYPIWYDGRYLQYAFGIDFFETKLVPYPPDPTWGAASFKWGNVVNSSGHDIVFDPWTYPPPLWVKGFECDTIPARYTGWYEISDNSADAHLWRGTLPVCAPGGGTSHQNGSGVALMGYKITDTQLLDTVSFSGSISGSTIKSATVSFSINPTMIGQTVRIQSKTGGTVTGTGYVDGVTSDATGLIYYVTASNARTIAGVHVF